MKRKQKRLLGFLLACMMICLPVSQSLAAGNYDASAALSNQVLFPGDSLINVAEEMPIFMDGEAVSSEIPGTWTNSSTDKVYTAATAEDGASIQLTTAGYVLVVERGESKKNDEGADNSRNHYSFSAEETPEIPQDVAFYSAGETVKLKAADPDEGMVFAGWETNDAASVAEPSNPETTLVMPEKKVTVTALYEEAPAEPPATEPAADPNAADPSVEPAADPNVVDPSVEPAADPNVVDPSVEPAADPNVVDPSADQEVDLTIDNTDPAEADPLIEVYNEGDPVTYSVFVTDGSVSEETGNGPYEAGTVVKVNANDYTADGLVFESWSVDSMNLEVDLSSSSIEFNMPEGDVYLTAHFKTAEPEQTEPQETDPAETNPSESDPAETNSVETDPSESDPAETNPVESDPAEGDPAQTDEPQQLEVPTEAPVVNTHEVVVENGTGGGTYAVGETVTVEAQEIEGQTFSHWKADNEAVQLENPEQAITTFAMPDAAVTVSAEYTTQIQVDEPLTDPEPTNTDAPDSTNTDVPEPVNTDVPDSTNTDIQEPANTDVQEPVNTNGDEGSGSQDTNPVPVATYSLTTPAGASVKVGENDIAAAEDGSYTVEQGAKVMVTAPAVDGQKFTGWTASDVNAQTVQLTLDGQNVALNQQTLTFEMPAYNVKVDATYEKIPAQYTIRVANGTVTGGTANGDGSWTVTEGTQIVVTANPAPAGEAFSGWRITDSNGADVNPGVDTAAASVTLTPVQSLSFQANYTGVQYSVSVTNGTSNYATAVSGTSVTITANAAPEGMEFDSWSVTSGNVSLANASSATTTFTMPTANVSITASYRKKTYSLTVKNGSSDAERYYMDDEPVISANYPETGKEFDYWYAESGNVVFDEDYLWRTTFTMPASDVTVSAKYKDGPSTSDNKILDIVEGGEYYTGSTIKFTASGAGMDKDGLNPGDYRYRPTGYQISNVTGNWEAAPYTTSMAIKAVGEYTLKVTFRKEVYDGEKWVADGTTDTKAVTFRVVNNTSVATGDSTPIVTVALIAGAALLIFLILLVVFIRRRRK